MKQNLKFEMRREGMPHFSAKRQDQRINELDKIWVWKDFSSLCKADFSSSSFPFLSSFFLPFPLFLPHHHHLLLLLPNLQILLSLFILLFFHLLSSFFHILSSSSFTSSFTSSSSYSFTSSSSPPLFSSFSPSISLFSFQLFSPLFLPSRLKCSLHRYVLLGMSQK